MEGRKTSFLTVYTFNRNFRTYPCYLVNSYNCEMYSVLLHHYTTANSWFSCHKDVKGVVSFVNLTAMLHLCSLKHSAKIANELYSWAENLIIYYACKQIKEIIQRNSQAVKKCGPLQQGHAV